MSSRPGISSTWASSWVLAAPAPLSPPGSCARWRPACRFRPWCMETDSPDIPPQWLYATAAQRAAGQPQGLEHARRTAAHRQRGGGSAGHDGGRAGWRHQRQRAGGVAQSWRRCHEPLAGSGPGGERRHPVARTGQLSRRGFVESAAVLRPPAKPVLENSGGVVGDATAREALRASAWPPCWSTAWACGMCTAPVNAKAAWMPAIRQGELNDFAWLQRAMPAAAGHGPQRRRELQTCQTHRSAWACRSTNCPPPAQPTPAGVSSASWRRGPRCFLRHGLTMFEPSSPRGICHSNPLFGHRRCSYRFAFLFRNRHYSRMPFMPHSSPCRRSQEHGA